MKLLTFLVSLMLAVQLSTQNRANKILMYHITSNESIEIIDKSNKVSLINGQQNHADFFKPDPRNVNNQLPKHYKLLFSNSEYMVIGTKEKVLNISFVDLQKNSQSKDLAPWISIARGRETKCFKPSTTYSKENLYHCHNYITAFIQLKNSMIQCGTNAGLSSCRRYTGKNHNQEYQNPQLSAVYRITSNNYMDVHQIPPFLSDDSIYYIHSGSYIAESTINKQIMHDEKFDTLIQTPKGALKNAKFRATFSHGDKNYFIFYETETQIANSVTFKTPLSLIGEVCKNDQGKNSYLDNKKRFLTFKKAIIYCYLPDYQDGFHLKYTEIQAVSQPVSLNENDAVSDEVFYAIFTFRRSNSVDSALCKYKMSKVQETMKGYFKSMAHSDRIVYKKPLDTCDSYLDLSDSELKKYYNEMTQNYKFQMEQNIYEPALFALNNAKFTAIAVDSPRVANNFNEVIFIGLEDGRVFKVLIQPLKFMKNGQKLNQPTIVQEYKFFETPVKSLIINEKTGKLVVISDEAIRSIDLDSSCRNMNIYRCGQCLKLQDPYCAWSIISQTCQGNTNENEDMIRVSRFPGRSQCSSEIDDYEVEAVNAPILSQQNKNTENLLTAIFLTALLTCLLSVGLTCLLINKRLKMSNYLTKNLSTTLSSNRSSASSTTTSYNNYTTEKFLPTVKPKTKYHRCQNFYESSLKPMLDLAIFTKKKQNLEQHEQRYDIASAAPTVNTNMSTSTDCTQTSPNSDLLQPKSINDTLSSSNESCCFDAQTLSDDCQTHANCDRYTKRPYSSPLSTKKMSQLEQIEVINMSSNLLDPKLNFTRNSNV